MNNANRPLSSSRRLPSFVLTGIIIAAQMSPAYSQAIPDERNTIEVFKRVAAGVVHVQALRVVAPGEGDAVAGQGTGSGFLIDRAGHVLTNYHVVEGSSDVKLLLSGGRTFDARLVGTAPAFDIALLRADTAGATETDLAPLPLGDSDKLEIGQKVLAIGNPLGLHNTLTTGVLSGLSRDIPGAPVGLGQAFLQTDAAINPGNSGGPLLDSSGNVIGVNSVVAREGQNISFAIPINFVKKILPELISMGHVYRPGLGFSALPIAPGMATLLGLSVRSGLLVQEVVEGSPAGIAGLRAGGRMIPMNETVYVLGGDVITAVNGKSVKSPHDLTLILLGSKPGDHIQLTVVRGEERKTLVLTLPPMHF
jgi:S1-C subfamily serine protease